MPETDRIYSWIRNVITSCTHKPHIKCCEALIAFYEKQKPEPDPYQVNALKVYLQLKVDIIDKRGAEEETAGRDEEVWNMYNSGRWTIKDISESLGMKKLEVDDIINKKLRH